MSFVSVPYEGTQTGARRNVHLPDGLPPTVDFTRRTYPFSATRNPAAEDDLPDSARHDDRAGREG